MYILDTDIIIYYLKGNENVINNLGKVANSKINTSIITQAELYYGVFKSARIEKNRKLIESFLGNIPVLPFCSKSSLIFAEQKAKLATNGNNLADMDLMIASIAMKNNYMLVTNNTKHFNRLKGLKLENWTSRI